MASINLKLPDREFERIEKARGEMKRLTFIRMLLRDGCAAAERGELFPEPTQNPHRPTKLKVIHSPKERRQIAAAIEQAAVRVPDDSD